MSGTFVSYAQNYEDVMLWRALRNEPAGFYIDVGASEPVADSVTKAFYEAGWRGVNIEPAEAAYSMLVKDRPRDVNLNIAVGAEPGTQELFLVGGGVGLTTVVDEYAGRHEASGWDITTVNVPRRTLADVCEEFAAEEIHFLKIDVEGAEQAVLEGADFTRWRPWIVVVEATEPNSTTPVHEAWDPILVKSGYTFVYFDGLNRFYLAEERAEGLKRHFEAPPHILDNFEQHRHAVVIQDLAQARSEVAGLEVELDAVQQELFEASRTLGVLSRDVHNGRLAQTIAERDAAKARSELKAATRTIARQQQTIAGLKRRVAQIRRSTSWRVTLPLRVASRALAKARSK